MIKTTKTMNFLAREVLTNLGNSKPTQKHIDLMHSILSNAVIHKPMVFDEKLSEREISCLFWAAKGKTSEETAGLLNISPSTVESHRKQIKRKLNCFTLSQAVFEGIKWGYLQPFTPDEEADKRAEDCSA